MIETKHDFQKFVIEFRRVCILRGRLQKMWIGGGKVAVAVFEFN